MLQRNRVNFALFSLSVDLILTISSLIIAFNLRIVNWMPFTPVTTLDVPRWLFAVIPILWISVLVFHSVYDPKKTLRIVSELMAVSFAQVSAALILAGLLYLTERAISRGFFLTFVLVNISLLFAWRIILRAALRYYRWPFPPSKMLIVGAGEVGQRLAQFIHEYGGGRINLVGYIDDHVEGSVNGLSVLGSVETVKSIVQTQQIDDVVIALPMYAYERVQELSLSLRDTATQIRVIPDYFNLALYRAAVQEYGGIPLINLREPALNNVQRLTKRIFDVIVSSIVLLLISPIMLLVALAIRLDSDGGVFYKPIRIGENGKPFKMYKFRSMVENADQLRHQVVMKQSDGSILHKTKNDPRVTSVGKFIRRTSLDELPQLLNVLKGDMSLVGPRPEQPWLVEQYEPWQHVRFSVPQGITGWWQINGRSDKPLHHNTSEDVYYIQNYSIWMDLIILLKTPLVVLRGKGAY